MGDEWERLVAFAAAIGVTFEFADDLDPKHPGEYCDHTRHIRILAGMGVVKTISTFAHELGHAVLRHTVSMFEWLNTKHERAADEWAAHFLINIGEYRLAEEKFGTNTKWIAQELRVLERLIVAYERTLHRLGDAVYVGAKMGAGQYAARFEAEVA